MAIGPPIGTRRYTRYDFDAHLQGCTISMLNRQTVLGRSVNINEGGMGGVFPVGWEVGAQVTLHFSVPVSTTPVVVKGIVRNRASYHYGFEFVDLMWEQKRIIARTCKTLELLH
jgi:hypothetical protein